ncbi:hypothetical protein [Bacillus sp. XF8]|nr:hypothetical protein [Bacillus sp. XF8]
MNVSRAQREIAVFFFVISYILAVKGTYIRFFVFMMASPIGKSF